MLKRNYPKHVLMRFFMLLFTHSSFSQVVSVSADKMNVFYIGVNNPVKIAASNFAPKDLVVSITHGRMSGSNGFYVVTCDSVGYCTITVSSPKDKKHHIWTSEFRVKLIPIPVFKIGPYGICASSVSKRIILDQQYVRAELENFDFDARYQVDSFHVSIIRDSIIIDSLINKTNRISEAVQEAFSKLKGGDIIVFDRIIVHSRTISSSLKGFYSSENFDENGIPIFKSLPENKDNYLILELPPMTLKIYE